MNPFPDSLWNNIPHWLAAVIAVLIVLIYGFSKHDLVTRTAASMSQWAKRGRGSKRQTSVDYQIADLYRQVTFLEEQLAELRLRDEMYWAWILTDQEWHRQHEFNAAEHGWDTHPHKSFMEFRDEWLAQRVTRRIRTVKPNHHQQQGESPF